MALAGLKGHLQYLVSEPVAVQAGDGHGRLLVICHGNEAEALALVGVEVSDHLDVGDGAKRAEHLPQDALVGVLAQVVDEDAPAGGGVPRDADSSHPAHVIHAHGRKPGEEVVNYSRQVSYTVITSIDSHHNASSPKPLCLVM